MSESDIPLVSVIMPVRNGGDALIAAIESIRASTLKSFELIVIDDGSTDHTSRILDYYRELDPRIVVISQPGKGISPSLNAGIAAARGQFIARQDADDSSHYLRLEEQARLMVLNPNCVLCTSWVRFIDSSGRSALSFRPPNDSELIKRDLLQGLNPIVHGSVMMRSDALRKLTKIYRGKHGEDLDLWLRIASLGEFRTLCTERYFYRLNQQGLSIKNLAAQRALRSYIFGIDFRHELKDYISDDDYEAGIEKVLASADARGGKDSDLGSSYHDLRVAIRTEDTKKLATILDSNNNRIPRSVRIFFGPILSSACVRATLRYFHDWGRGLQLVPLTLTNLTINAPWITQLETPFSDFSEHFEQVRTTCLGCLRALPKVSVLMAVRDEKVEFLQVAIESILSQTLSEIEFLIVDDGSLKEDTLQLLKMYVKLSDRIRLVRVQRIGLTKSLNLGISSAKAELIARQDSDDWSAPTRLAQQLEFLTTHRECGVVGSYTMICNEAGENLWVKRISRNALKPAALSKVNPISHGSLCFRRSFLSEIGGYDERFEYAQDYELLVRAGSVTSIGVINQPLYFLRRHSRTRTVVRYKLQRLFAKAANDLDRRDRILAAIEEGDDYASKIFSPDSQFESEAMHVDLALLNSGFWVALKSASKLLLAYPSRIAAWVRFVRVLLFRISPLRSYLFR